MVRSLYVSAIFFISVWCFSCNQPSGSQARQNADTVIEMTKESIATTPAQDTSRPVDQQAERIGKILRDQLVKNDLKVLTDEDRHFSYSEADLNGDNEPEIFVAMKGRYFCGNAGCTVFLLNTKGEKINTFTIVNGPIVITTDKTRGWYDLVILSGGHRYRVKYNGTSYPGNPSVQPEFKEAVSPAFKTVLGDGTGVNHF